MSVRRACYIGCDNCGDPAEVTTSGGAAEARALARIQGYTRARIEGRLVDLCPGCAGTEVLDGVRRQAWDYGLREPAS